MPLPMVHLSVGKKLIDMGFEISNLPQFYLGLISPDAIHMRQNSNRLGKNETHLIPERKKWIDVNEEEYCRFIIDFIKANSDNIDIDFLWGYGIHILTDMYWTKHIYLKFRDDYKKDTASI